MPGSSIPGFFSKSRDERLDAVAGLARLGPGDAGALRDAAGGLSFEDADRMAENAIGTFALPLGIATNFRINGRDLLVPMVTEEPSVVAAASKGAKIARIRGGFSAAADESHSIGQIQVIGAGPGAAARVVGSSREILEAANSKSDTLRRMGKGAKRVSCRWVAAPSGRMLVVELLVDVGDAMGANVTNTMCEAAAPLVEGASGGRALLKILSNYSTGRMARASAVFDGEATGGARAVDDAILAFEFADCDVYRAVTHNKGIMNGVVAVANATGQDSRAIEAAAHAHAASSGRYRSLSRWGRDGDGNLVGELEIPLSVGTVGGVANVHPVARACARILGASSARDLACVMAAAGLAQNYAAVRALSTEGIQRGHMRLHARNLAAAAGADPAMAAKIARQMIEEGEISLGRARDLLGRV